MHVEHVIKTFNKVAKKNRGILYLTFARPHKSHLQANKLVNVATANATAASVAASVAASAASAAAAAASAMPRNNLPMGAGGAATSAVSAASSATAMVASAPALTTNARTLHGPLTAVERLAAERVALLGPSAAGNTNNGGSSGSTGGYHQGNTSGSMNGAGGIASGGMMMPSGAPAAGAAGAPAMPGSAYPRPLFPGGPPPLQQLPVPFPWPLPACNPSAASGATMATTGAQQQQQQQKQQLPSSNNAMHSGSAAGAAVATTAAQAVVGILPPPLTRLPHPLPTAFAGAADTEVIEINDDDDDDDKGGVNSCNGGTSSARVAMNGFDARWDAASQVVNNMIVDFYHANKREATQPECDALMNAARQYLGLPLLSLEDSSLTSPTNEQQRLTPHLFRLAVTQAAQRGAPLNFSIILGSSFPPPVPLRPPPQQPQQPQQQPQQQPVGNSNAPNDSSSNDAKLKMKKDAAALALVTAAGSKLATLSAVSSNDENKGASGSDESSSSSGSVNNGSSGGADEISTLEESEIRSVVQALLDQVCGCVVVHYTIRASSVCFLPSSHAHTTHFPKMPEHNFVQYP